MPSRAICPCDRVRSRKAPRSDRSGRKTRRLMARLKAEHGAKRRHISWKPSVAVIDIFAASVASTATALIAKTPLAIATPYKHDYELRSPTYPLSLILSPFLRYCLLPIAYRLFQNHFSMRNTGFIKDRTHAAKSQLFVEPDNRHLSVEINLSCMSTFGRYNSALEQTCTDAFASISL